MLDQRTHILGLGGIDDIKEAFPVLLICLGLLVREELGEGGLGHGIIKEVDYAELIIVGNVNGAELAIWDEALPACEDLLQEVFGYLLLRGKIIAAYD
jgi:hypothetical protein